MRDETHCANCFEANEILVANINGRCDHCGGCDFVEIEPCDNCSEIDPHTCHLDGEEYFPYIP